MAEELVIDGPALGRAAECAPILRALPEWFGIERAVGHYVDAVEHLPTIVARHRGEAVGFVAIKRHSVYAAELYVLGVHPAYHRHGIGRRLIAAAERAMRQERVEFVQVKTLGPSHPSPEYARTRAFYLALGYRPLEELLTLWDAENPCLLLVKYLPAQQSGDQSPPARG
jgi:GNAT superfamily N-acetyltransferase